MKQFKDKRGLIKDLLVGKKGAATYITFEKGAVRGNHLHKKTNQVDMVLSGALQVYTGQDCYVISAGDFVGHNAGVPHAYKALKKSEIISLTYGVRIGENYSKDTYAHKLL